MNLPPFIIYAAEEALRHAIAEQLSAFSEAEGLRPQILLSTGDPREAARGIQAEHGIFLLLLCVASNEGAVAAAAALEQQAVEQNRDNYTVYWLPSQKLLPAAVSLCLHPAGIIAPPDSAAQLRRILGRIAADYRSLAERPASLFLTLRSGGALYRIAVESIRYIEANDRKIQIWTRRQCLVLYEKLSSIEQKLGDGFIRCHRSYLVNRSEIEVLRLAEMELVLRGGERLPVSRSGRDALKQKMLEEE